MILMFSFCVFVSLDFVVLFVIIRSVFFDTLFAIFAFSSISRVLALLRDIWFKLFVSITVLLVNGLLIFFALITIGVG